MSRDRAKITFDLQRQVRRLQLDFLLFGGHKRGSYEYACKINKTQYWSPEEDCDCGFNEKAAAIRKELYP